MHLYGNNRSWATERRTKTICNASEKEERDPGSDKSIREQSDIWWEKVLSRGALYT